MILTVMKPGWIIKGVIVRNEHLFKETGGTHVQILSESMNRVKVAIMNEKNSKQSLDV